MLQDIKEINAEDILEEVNNIKLYNYRFVAMTCEKEGESYELTYHFDLDFQLKHLRFTVDAGAVLKSISSIYPAALLIENEYQDLYGFKYEGLLVDYKGRLYLAENSPKTPMA